jgi:hypothetical protein
MKQMKRKFWAVLALVLTVAVFPAAAWSSVSFTDGEYVKLGYSTATPPVWEVKELPGATENLFLGASLSAGGGYGDTNDWLASNVRRYLNTAYLTAHFSPDELATGVLTPYGDAPIYDVVVPDTGGGFNISSLKSRMKSAAAAPDPSVLAIPPSSAGDSLIWILNVQELQEIFNQNPALPWNDATGHAARLV